MCTFYTNQRKPRAQSLLQYTEPEKLLHPVVNGTQSRNFSDDGTYLHLFFVQMISNILVGCDSWNFLIIKYILNKATNSILGLYLKVALYMYKNLRRGLKRLRHNMVFESTIVRYAYDNITFLSNFKFRILLINPNKVLSKASLICSLFNFILLLQISFTCENLKK